MFQAFVSYPERASAPNGVVDQQYGDLGEEGLQDTPPPGVQAPHFCEGRLFLEGRIPARSTSTPTPAGPRVRVPRPTGDGAG